MERDDRMVAQKVGDDQVLLLFKKGVSPEHAAIPPPDGAGQLHLAFGISPSRFSAGSAPPASGSRALQCGRQVDAVPFETRTDTPWS